MDDGVVPYANVIADAGGRFFVRAMDAGAILDVRALADHDGIHIAPNDRVEPNGALLAKRHLADNGRGASQPTA